MNAESTSGLIPLLLLRVGQRSTSGNNIYTSLQEYMFTPPPAGHTLGLPGSFPWGPEPFLGQPWEGLGRDVPSPKSLILCSQLLLCHFAALGSWMGL